jgi:ribosome recycling factor
MAYDFTPFKKASTETLDWLKREYSSIRTGRAAPGILDAISVEVYGSKMTINQVATVTIEGAQSLRVTPWDKGVVKSIESAIRDSSIGLSVAVDESGLRISFPELSSERRTQLQRLAKEKLEEARIRVRGEREKVLRDLDTQEKAGSMSEDEKFRLKADLQKLIDQTNSELEDLSAKKDKEILS